MCRVIQVRLLYKLTPLCSPMDTSKNFLNFLNPFPSKPCSAGTSLYCISLALDRARKQTPFSNDHTPPAIPPSPLV